LCSHDFYVILTNGYGELFTQTLNVYVIVHNGRTADRAWGRRRKWELEKDNGTKEEFGDTMIGKKKWRRGQGKANREGIGEQHR